MAVLNSASTTFLNSCLACPRCKGDLDVNDEGLVCVSCAKHYPVQDGVPLFAMPEQEPGQVSEEVAFRKRYEWQYQQGQSAESYDKSFRSSARKRQRTRRELEIVEKMLASQKSKARILDIPCGGGRLSAPIRQASNELIEADISPAQLALAMSKHSEDNSSDLELAGMVASAIQIPLKNGSVDGAICARLTHHLPDPGERRNLVNELLRVARNFVIFSFTDQASIQSFGRRLRGKAINPSAMSVAEIESIASAQNARVKRYMTVSNIGPRHRFVLLEK